MVLIDFIREQILMNTHHQTAQYTTKHTTQRITPYLATGLALTLCVISGCTRQQPPSASVMMPTTRVFASLPGTPNLTISEDLKDKRIWTVQTVNIAPKLSARAAIMTEPIHYKCSEDPDDDYATVKQNAAIVTWFYKGTKPHHLVLDEALDKDMEDFDVSIETLNLKGPTVVQITVSSISGEDYYQENQNIYLYQYLPKQHKVVKLWDGDGPSGNRAMTCASGLSTKIVMAPDQKTLTLSYTAYKQAGDDPEYKNSCDLPKAPTQETIPLHPH